MINPVTTQQVQRLPAQQRTLLNKFYRSHHSRMRIQQNAEIWVIRNPEIIAATCLTPIDDGFWLTGLFVAPSYRQAGIARQLLQHLQSTYPCAPIWLFCQPDLAEFYQRLNFQIATQLPESLASRLTRYQQHKKLIPMQSKTTCY